MSAACSDPDEQELLTREEVGHVFDAAYTRRNQVCLGCHNSEFSVTYSSDPAQNRHFSLAPLLEKSVFGGSFGVDERRSHAVFRTADLLYREAGEPFADCLDENANPDFEFFPQCDERGVVVCADGFTPSCLDPSGRRRLPPPTCGAKFDVLCPEAEPPPPFTVPWGMTGCGQFLELATDDPAGVDARLGSITGPRPTVFNLEQALARGIDTLSLGGLELGDDFEPTDPDAALANLLAMNIVDVLWRELTGAGLTIVTGFPRTLAAHDMLKTLSERFAASHFSLQSLILDILDTPYFNVLAPDAGCGEPYGLPQLFNVWTRDEPDPARRLNSSADGVHPVASRTLLSATYAALGWPSADERFPGFFDEEPPPMAAAR